MSAVGDARKRLTWTDAHALARENDRLAGEATLAPIVALATRADDQFGFGRSISPESLWAAIEQARQVAGGGDRG